MADEKGPEEEAPEEGAPEEESATELNALVGEFVAKTSVVAAFLLGRDGTVLASGGDTEFIRGETLAHVLREGFSAAEGISGFTEEKQGYLIEPSGRDTFLHHLFFSGQTTLVSRFEDRKDLPSIEEAAREAVEAAMAWFEKGLEEDDLDDTLLT